MQAFRLQNFRGFPDTGWIELKPLTLLVGANSTGKSSLLRFLPLLRQSMATETGVPFAWAREGGVDLGTAQDVHRRGAAEPLRIGVRVDQVFRHARLGKNSETALKVPTEYELSLSSKTPVGETRQVKLSAGRFSTKIVVHSTDGTGEGTLTTRHKSVKTIFFSNGVVPVSDEVGPGSIRSLAEILQSAIPLNQPTTENDRLLFTTAFRLMRSRSLPRAVHGSTKEFRGIIGELFNQASETQATTISDEQVQNAQAALWDATIGDSLSELRTALMHWTQTLEYIGPARFPPTRYHRMWADRPTRLMPDGANLAVLFDGLSRRDRDTFNSFLTEALGYSLSLKAGGGNAELTLTNVDGDSFNIADLGFGLSQVLPVYLQAHLAHRNPRDRHSTPASLFVVEQPELHLHPQLQAKLADLFVGMSARSEHNLNPVPCFVETHSKAILERAGELIEEGAIPAEDVQVLLFEKEGKDCTVRATTFDEQGMLRAWPVGFLSR